jgi:hypothetical protein
VAFIHQYQVIALKGVHSNCLGAHLIPQAGDFKNLDRLASEQAATVLVEDFGRDTGELEFS